MYKVNPKNLYVMDWALNDPRCVARLERMVAGIGRRQDDVVVIKAEDLPDVIRNGRWVGEARQGAYREPGDPDLVFNAFRWVTPEQRKEIAESELYKRCIQAYQLYGECQQWFTGGRTMAMFGAAPFYHYERRPEWRTEHVCWSLHDLHSCWGCFHRCAYCQRGSVYVINLNLEEFLEQVDALIKAESWQKTFRYDVEQDVLAIEPEYGACEMLVNDFARRPDHYLILFSKSGNVDPLLSLDHKGHTIMLWTLTSRTVSERYEPMTANMEQRIEAARRCQEAGYPVRFKCKPILPLKNWREEITEMLELMYSRVTPENISMETVFFDSVSEMDHTVGLDNLDPDFVAAAQAAETEAGSKWNHAAHGPRPFTFEVKEQIYRYLISESQRISPRTPVTLCAETSRMWDALDDLLPGKPWNYVCNCGPHCIPGCTTISGIEGPDAPRIEAAERLGAIPFIPKS